MIKIILPFIALWLFSCQQGVNTAAEKQKILALIQQTERAHFNQDAGQFYHAYADVWTDVRNGRINTVNKADQMEATQEYLDNMVFEELTALDTPRIELSADATLASHAGSVLVKGYHLTNPVFWVVAWENVLRKVDNRWTVISATNTEAGPAGQAEVILVRAQDVVGTLSDEQSIRALANCQGPQRSFTTCVLSRRESGRMEQIYGDGHYILSHNMTSSVSIDLNRQMTESDSALSTIHFIKGHELHWLIFNPLDRFNSPVMKEITDFNGRQAFDVECKDDFDRPVNLYYAFDSWMPLGFTLHTGPQDQTVTVSYDEWEERDGLQLLKQATFSEGENVFIYDFIDIRLIRPDDPAFQSQEGLIN